DDNLSPHSFPTRRSSDLSTASSQGQYDIVGFNNSHRPSKRLGQNFLLDQSIASEIVSSIRPSETDTVLEPGPGHGTLTRLLRERSEEHTSELQSPDHLVC